MSKLVSTNPAKDYEVVGEVEITTDQAIADKIKSAHQATRAWKELGISERIRLLKPICDELEKRSSDFANMITAEMGKPIKQARSEVGGSVEEFRWYLENVELAVKAEITQEDEQSIHKVVYEPYGVAAVIAPWNFPLSTAMPGIVPNLLVGNAVIFKTSEECPLTGKIIEEVFNSQQLPEGVFNEVYGDGKVGEALVRGDVDLICFTGSTAVGKKLYTIAADKFIKAILEMGGSSPCVVFDDADLDVATEQIILSRFLNCGQVCDVTKRVIVHEAVKDKLTEKLVQALSAQKVGDPMNEATDLSSLVAKRQQELISAQLDDTVRTGAHIVFQAPLDPSLQGAYVPPTILDGINRDMRVWREEVFGPVLPIMSFSTEDEALELANGTPYGLGARIVTEDTAKAQRMASRIDAGTVEVNAGDRWQDCNPFGGYKSSGIGREHGVVGIRELCQVKLISSSKSA